MEETSPQISSPPPHVDSDLKTKFKKLISGIKSFPLRNKKLFSFGVTVLLLVAIPLTVFTIINSRTSFFNRAATSEPPMTGEPPATPFPSGYFLVPGPYQTINTYVHGLNEGYSISAKLYLNGLQVTNQTGFNYQWSIDNPSIANITPRAHCIYDPQTTPPCAYTHLDIKAVNPGTTKIYLSVSDSNSTFLASTFFTLNVSPTPPMPTPTPVLSPTPAVPNCGGTCGTNYNCGSSLVCYNGFCRNPSCVTSTNCFCTPGPMPTATPVLNTTRPIPTPTPIPAGVVISTTALRTGRVNYRYSATVAGYDKYPYAKLIMTITNLPAGLSQGPCALSAPGGIRRNIYCYINGTPKRWGLSLVRVRLTDDFNKSARRTLLLIIRP